jgi:hypothetical protein
MPDIGRTTRPRDESRPTLDPMAAPTAGPTTTPGGSTRRGSGRRQRNREPARRRLRPHRPKRVEKPGCLALSGVGLRPAANRAGPTVRPFRARVDALWVSTALDVSRRQVARPRRALKAGRPPPIA